MSLRRMFGLVATSLCVHLGLVFWGPVAAQAGTVTATFNGFDPGNPIIVTRTLLNPYLTGPGYDSRQVDPGRFTWTRTGGTFGGTLVGNSPQFYAFCIEPLEFINQGSSYTYSLDPLESGATNIGGMGATKANLIRELFYDQMPNLSATITDQKASALGVAIWEIVRENPNNSLNVFSGDASFSASNLAGTNMLNLAQSYLNQLTGHGPMLNNLYALDINGAQDVLVQVASPEPATLMGLAAGIVAIPALRRRKK